MDNVVVVYLVLMFIALYFFSFFVILTFRNRHRINDYPSRKKVYSVSVIIPAYNEEDSIKETIEHVSRLKYPKGKIEIIVVDNNSKDNTKSIVEKILPKYNNLRFIECKISGKANAVNAGIAKAKGELIGVVDADSFPEPDSLLKLTGYFDDEQMGAVTSFVTIRNKEENFFARIQSLEYVIMGWNKKMLDFLGAVYVTNGPLSLYRKKYLIKIGGFDPKSITEDIEITWNMIHHNFKTALCFDARVSTISPRTFKEWWRQRVRWGIGGLQAISKYKKTFFKRGMLGSFIVPYISFSIILSLFSFIFSLYLLSKIIMVRVLTFGYSVSTNSSAFSFSDLNLHPSVMIFFIMVMFTFSFFYMSYILKTTKYVQRLTIRKFFNLLFYIFVYLSLYPVVWFASIFRFVREDYRW